MQAYGKTIDGITHPEKFSPLGRWIKMQCKDSHLGLNVSNVDFVLHDRFSNKVMLVEEKSGGATVGIAQGSIFKILDKALREQQVFDYQGYYVVNLSGDNVEPDNNLWDITPKTTIKINGRKVTQEQLVEHLNFEKKIVEPIDWSNYTFDWSLNKWKKVEQ